MANCKVEPEYTLAVLFYDVGCERLLGLGYGIGILKADVERSLVWAGGLGKGRGGEGEGE